MCISLHIPIRTIQLPAVFDDYSIEADESSLDRLGRFMIPSRRLSAMDYLPPPNTIPTPPRTWERPVAEKRVKKRLAAILGADVVGYSRLMEVDEIHRAPLCRRQGETIKVGDSFAPTCNWHTYEFDMADLSEALAVHFG